jgi:hypothetical protein
MWTYTSGDGEWLNHRPGDCGRPAGRPRRTRRGSSRRRHQSRTTPSALRAATRGRPVVSETIARDRTRRSAGPSPDGLKPVGHPRLTRQPPCEAGARGRPPIGARRPTAGLLLSRAPAVGRGCRRRARRLRGPCRRPPAARPGGSPSTTGVASSEKNDSNPPGDAMPIRRAVGEVIRYACGTSRGSATRSPARASMRWPPTTRRASPSTTKKYSSSRWCTCRGEAAPRAPSQTHVPTRPPVWAPVSWTLMRPPYHQSSSSRSRTTDGADAAADMVDLLLMGCLPID